MTSNNPSARARLQALFPPHLREVGYRLSAALTTLLFAYGILDASTQAIWAQLGVGLVTLVFALVYAETPVRIALYTITGPLGAALLYYGIVTDVRWALITAAVAQAFGIVTAAAKTVNTDGPIVVT